MSGISLLASKLKLTQNRQTTEFFSPSKVYSENSAASPVRSLLIDRTTRFRRVNLLRSYFSFWKNHASQIRRSLVLLFRALTRGIFRRLHLGLYGLSRTSLSSTELGVHSAEVTEILGRKITNNVDYTNRFSVAAVYRSPHITPLLRQIIRILAD